MQPKRINSRAADVVADYVRRRQWDGVDVALEETADYWGVESAGLAVYLRSRVPADADALRPHLPFLGAHYLGEP